jgi:hypothetical protein
MDTFLSIHQNSILGTLSTFDRMIFKGHLNGFFPDGAFARFLSKQGVLLKDFKTYVATCTATLKTHAQHLAQDAGRPYLYLEKPTTARRGTSKEEQARAIATRDGITTGLICVFAAVEPCRAFGIRRNAATHHLEVVRQKRQCLHFYFYYLDPEFGFMHVRLESWFPFEIQIYINGHEWLAHQLDLRHIAYHRHDNKLTRIADPKTATTLCEKFARRKWPRVLNAFARRVNPHLATIRRAGFKGYYWVMDQGEYATDVLFRERGDLETLFPALVERAMTAFSADDVLRFLGRKPHGNFQGEVTTDLKRRPEGYRVKHTMARNSLKMYDDLLAQVLRVETTINNPREFRVLRVSETPQGRQRRWLPMGKGVANLWRYRQVGQQSNSRYLNALAQAHPKGKAMAELDRLCHPHMENGQRYARFNPVTAEDCALFAAVLAGEHALNGFRNKHLQTRLYPRSAVSEQERRQRSGHVTRLLAKLRGHGLIAKVQGSRLYRATESGTRLMSAAIYYRKKEFPTFVFEATESSRS